MSNFYFVTISQYLRNTIYLSKNRKNIHSENSFFLFPSFTKVEQHTSVLRGIQNNTKIIYSDFHLCEKPTEEFSIRTIFIRHRTNEHRIIINQIVMIVVISEKLNIFLRKYRGNFYFLLQMFIFLTIFSKKEKMRVQREKLSLSVFFLVFIIVIILWLNQPIKDKEKCWEVGCKGIHIFSMYYLSL